MKNSKLLEILKTLNPKEIKEFDKFVNSIYFVNRKVVPVLFSVIKKHHPDFRNGLTKEIFYKQAFPGKRYNDTIMRKYLSELHKALMDYLAYKNFRKDRIAYNRHLANELADKRFFDIAEKIIDNSLLGIKEQPLKNERYYENKLKLMELQEQIILGHKSFFSNVGTSKPVDIALRDVHVETYLNYVIISALKHYFSILMDLKYFKFKVNYKLLDYILLWVEENSSNTSIVTEIYYFMVKSLKEPENTGYFYKLKTLFEKHSELIEIEEFSNFFYYFSNYCYAKLDKGKIEFLRERYEINKITLRRKDCFENTYIIPVVFDSFTIPALRLGEVQWTEDFIKSYGKYLHPDIKENTVNYSMAQLHHHKKQYGKALEHLSKMKFQNYFDRFKTNTLNLMIHYEMGMYDSALSLADTFRHFIAKNKKVTPYSKERGGNFINSIVLMIKFKLGETKHNITELKNIISAPHPLMNRKWLLEKVKELEQVT